MPVNFCHFLNFTAVQTITAAKFILIRPQFIANFLRSFTFTVWSQKGNRAWCAGPFNQVSSQISPFINLIFLEYQHWFSYGGWFSSQMGNGPLSLLWSFTGVQLHSTRWVQSSPYNQLCLNGFHTVAIGLSCRYCNARIMF